MTEKQLAELFVKENFSCYNIDCEKCKETNFLHQCLQNDVKVYCKEILGRGYKDRRIDALKNENRELKKEIGCLRTIKDDYKKLLKEIKEELAEKEIDLEYIKYHLISETIADWGRITKEDWEVKQ